MRSRQGLPHRIVAVLRVGHKIRAVFVIVTSLGITTIYLASCS